MEVRQRPFLPQDFARGHVEEEQQSLAIAARAHEPFALRMKGQVSDQALGFVAGELRHALLLPPVEDLDVRLAFEVVNVPDLAHAADCELRAVRREGQ